MADAARAPVVDRAIAAAVALLALRVVLGVLAGATQIADATAVRSAIATANPPLTSAQVHTVYRGIVGVVALAALFYAALYAVLAVQLRRHRPWARNATRLLAVLSAFAALGSLRETDPTVGHLLAAVILLVDVAILVLLTVPAAGRRFEAR